MYSSAGMPRKELRSDEDLIEGIEEATGGEEIDVRTLESLGAVLARQARPSSYLCTGTSVSCGFDGGDAHACPALYSSSGTPVICGSDTGEGTVRSEL